MKGILFAALALVIVVAFSDNAFARRGGGDMPLCNMAPQVPVPPQATAQNLTQYKATRVVSPLLVNTDLQIVVKPASGVDPKELAAWNSGKSAPATAAPAGKLAGK